MARIKDSQKLFSDRIEAICHEIEEKAKSSIEEPPPEKRFESVKVHQERVVLEVRECLKSLQEIYGKGMACIATALTELKKENELAEIQTWFENNEDRIATYLNSEDPDLGEKTIEAELNFPRKCIVSMHEAATYLLNQKKYDDALMAIAVCLQINPTLSPLWFTYASILQNRGDHEAAVCIFQIAGALDEQNPYVPAHMARSWISLDEWDLANQTLVQAKALCQGFPEYDDLLKYCDQLDEWMKRNQKV